MNGDDDEEFTVFVALHAAALQSSGIPQIYWRTLHHKINNEVCPLLTALPITPPRRVLSRTLSCDEL